MTRYTNCPPASCLSMGICALGSEDLADQGKAIFWAGLMEGHFSWTLFLQKRHWGEQESALRLFSQICCCSRGSRLLLFPCPVFAWNTQGVVCAAVISPWHHNSQEFSLFYLMVGKTIFVALVVNSYSCLSILLVPHFDTTTGNTNPHREELLCVGISPRGSDLKMKSSFSFHCSKEEVYPMGGETSTSKRRIETMICKQLCCVFENKEFAGI